MKLTLGDKVYESDLAALVEVTIGEARTIKGQTGLTIRGWEEGLKDLASVDPDVIAGLVWLLRSRAGEAVDWTEINALTINELATALDFTLTEGDQARIAEAGVRDWAELEALRSQVAESESAAPAEVAPPKDSIEAATVSVEVRGEEPATS